MTKETRLSPSPASRTRAWTKPAGVSIPNTVSSPPSTSPSSARTVATPMIPWPHMVLKPALWVKSTPKSASAVTGGTTMQPYMSAWPRGSHMRARRSPSNRWLASRRMARIEPPWSSGKPRITRRGSPSVWASTVSRRSQSPGGCQLRTRSGQSRMRCDPP